MSLSWAEAVDLGRPNFGLFFTEPVWLNLALTLNTVALLMPACIAAWSAVVPLSSIPIMQALTSTELLLPGMCTLLLRKTGCNMSRIARSRAQKTTFKLVHEVMRVYAMRLAAAVFVR